TIVLRYNTPIKVGIGIGIGKMYFQDRPYGFTQSMPSAELLLVDISDYEDYATYTNPYFYKIPLELTPFDTEFSNSFKEIKIDFDLSDGQIPTPPDIIEFSDMIFSVPYPNYELTINEVIIQSVSSEPTELTGYLDERVWQFTELEMFTSDNNPIDDTYTLTQTNNPLFWGDDKWLDYIMITDENHNYYGATILPQTSETEHQLHYDTDHFVWNNNFDQFQEYYGSQIQLPLIIEPDTELFFAYSNATAWQTPILLDIENIDAGTLDNVFDYDYLLTPRFEFWGDTVSENNAGEYDYELIQYYSESFTAYTATSGTVYTHSFELDDYSLENDFRDAQLFKIIALKPTLEEFEIIDDADYDISYNPANKEVQITDHVGGDDLSNYDFITIILNYSYGPISSFSEIQLTQTFHDDYISDPEATFYDYLSISFSYSQLSGEYLFEEDSQTITSSSTSFEYLPFNRNPAVSTNNKLNVDNSEMFIDFEIFYDPYNVIYEADIDMDGKKDYKQEIDVDKDGRIDITKYGIEDPEDPENIIWYSIIQDYVSEEVIVDKTMEEEKRTEWFDIADTAFADYELNIVLLLVSVLILPLLLYTMSTMVLPDVDYWAQKSVKQETVETQYIKSHYYSIRIDEDRDGYTDTQVAYERSNTVVQYKSQDYEKTLIAAKPQNVFTFLGEWIFKNVGSLIGLPLPDLVFNEFLTEEKLDNSDFSDTLIDPGAASALRATYRKFTKDTTVSYTSEYVQEKITVTDWVDGNIEQTRIYRDFFDENEIDSDIINSLSGAIYTIQNLDSGQSFQSVFTGEKLPRTDPKNEKWDLQTWEENISERFDSITTIYNDGSTTTWNKYETTITIEIPSRYNLYDDMYSNNPYTAVGETQFTIPGILITPEDGMVYDTSNKKLFKEGNAKSPGKYFYYDSDEDGFYETVYILENPIMTRVPGGRARGSFMGDYVYKVRSIGFNYDGEHDFSPYRKVNRKIKTKTDFDQLEAEGIQRYGASMWAYNFKKLKSLDLLFPEDPFDGYEPQDHIFEISKLVNPSEFNIKFPQLFYEVRHREYKNAWEIYGKQLEQEIAEQVIMTMIASTASGVLQWIPGVGQVLGTLAYIGIYSLLTKFNMDMKRHKAQAIERANTYTPISLEKVAPKSLNERSEAIHGYWEDTTIAALIGHPGAYYTEIQGEANNQMYTAQAIVSPANLMRDNPSKNSKGFTDYVWKNLWDASTINPDLMIGLDFDAVNLDYFLLTTELSSLNDNPDYTFKASAYNDLYNEYSHNTIGYLQQKIAEETNGTLSLIKPVIVGGVPQYIFIDGTNSLNQITMPTSHLYQPVIVSEDLAKEIQNEGTITVNIKTAYTTNTKGISHNTIFPEAELFSSKVPLSSHGFEYPITSIKIELIEDIDSRAPIAKRGIILTPDSPGFEDFFYVEFGNIYFEDNIDTMLISSQIDFDDMIARGEMSSSTMKYYRLTIKFDMIVPDSGSDAHKRLALSQATAYVIMDYMNQYSFAKSTANMISEIGYTETLTVRSSIISAPASLLGSWAIGGLKSILI
ncbi:hypothetical protein LCGC14_1338830, partial [marine sediment metagenome]